MCQSNLDIFIKDANQILAILVYIVRDIKRFTFKIKSMRFKENFNSVKKLMRNSLSIEIEESRTPRTAETYSGATPMCKGNIFVEK